MFTAALFIRAEKWKQPRCSSTHEWKNKMWILLGHEQMDPTIRDNMDGHKGYYIKWNKSETNTEILPIHGI